MKIYNLIPFKKIRHKLHDRYNQCEIKIEEETRCLVVAPHPDDEMIGVGGLMCLYPNHFDVVVMGSSGTDYGERRAKDHAKMRTDEFENVARHLGLVNHWIYQTYGVCGVEQMNNMFNNYIRDLKTSEYDYIFLPVPHDRHQDHNYITNNLFKRILCKNGYKKDLKIVFYEVWSLIPNPNVFINISSVIDKKTEILHLYKSAHVLFQYADIIRGLNRYRGTQANLPYGFAEGFYIDSIRNYLKKDYRISQNGK